MNTRQKIIGLAALPLAGLLAFGGTVAAQAAGSPAGTQVVQQAVTHRAGYPCPEHAVSATNQPACQPQQVRDRDRGTCSDHQPSPAVATVTSTAAHARCDGTCGDHADR